MSEWLDHSVVVDVDVPVEMSWELWCDSRANAPLDELD